MKVKDLIRELEQFNPELDLQIWHDTSSECNEHCELAAFDFVYLDSEKSLSLIPEVR